MKATPVAKTSLKAGDKTSLGVVTETKVSPSGKTIVITVKRTDGTTFTDRLSAAGNMMVFTDDASA
jgi:tricorn protease-like protein